MVLEEKAKKGILKIAIFRFLRIFFSLREKVFRRFNDRTQAYFLKKIIEIGEVPVGP